MSLPLRLHRPLVAIGAVGAVVLTAGNGKKASCDDASGCTKVSPDLPLSAGTATATAGTGLQTSLLGTMKLADGETHPTYNGWLLYEYVGDSGPAQGDGQGLQSFGGTWSAITPAGAPVTPAAIPSTAGSASSTGY